MEDMNLKWLEGQTMTIPVEEFIKMRIEMAELEQNYSDARSAKWKLESEIEELTKNLTEARKQIREIIGVDKE